MHRVPCGDVRALPRRPPVDVRRVRELRIAPGGFAERLRATHCVPLPDSLGEHDGIWVEPLACVLRAAELVPPGRVLVVGCGAIGLLWIAGAAAARRTRSSPSTRAPERLAGARELGAEVDDEPVAAAVLTAPAGLDDALRRLEPGGTLLVFAAPEEPCPYSLDAVYRKELSVVGSRSATPA